MRSSIARFARGVAVLASLAIFANAAAAQAAASVCKDGTPSAVSGRGACSGHGGVDAAATKAARSAAKAQARAAKADARAAKKATVAASAATFACSDGTTGKAGRGACSRHGGIAGSASASPQASAPTPRPAPVATARASTRSRASSAPAAASSGASEDNNPTGAIAQCNDGMYSHASNRRGACSRHGGVKSWTNG